MVEWEMSSRATVASSMHNSNPFAAMLQIRNTMRKNSVAARIMHLN